MSNGLILGHVEGKASKLRGIKALFDRSISDKVACQRFLQAFQRNPQQKRLLRLTRAVHTAVFAPTGTGKGTSFIIPFLQSVDESCGVVDPKGENYLLTADFRREMGHQVRCLDPFRAVTQTPDCFNPMAFIDKGSREMIDHCRDMAEALVVRTGEEKEPHWNDSAELWIASMIAFVVCYAEDPDKNLQSVRTLLANPAKLQAAVKMMCDSDMCEGMLARLGHQLTHYVDRELGSVLTNANRHLRFLDTLAVADNTTRSTFNPADLLTGKMSIYLVLPPQHLRAQVPLLRLWISSLMRAVVAGGLQEKTKVHFVLDEAASLGRMDALDDALDKYRGYGVRLQFYYQSLGQLKQCWPAGREQTLLSNSTQVFFAVNDIGENKGTADYISSRLGEETIVVEDWGEGESVSHQPAGKEGGSSTSTSRSRNRNFKQIGRKLLKPEEVLGLSERIAISFAPGVPPIWSRLVRYYEKDFGAPTGLSPAKTVLDTACLFLGTAVLAAMFTAAMFYHTFQ